MKQFWFIFLLPSLLIMPATALAQASGSNTTQTCDSQNIIITMDAPENHQYNLPDLTIGSGSPFGVNVKIPARFAQNSWSYFVSVIDTKMAGPRSEITNSADNRTLGSSPERTEVINGTTYNVYYWEFSNFLANSSAANLPQSFAIELKHAENVNVGPISANTPGNDVCIGSSNQLTVSENATLETSSCPITMPNNFNSGDPVTGTVNLAPLPDGATYGYRLDQGSHTTNIPRDPRNPVDIKNMVGYNPLKPSLLSNFDTLSPGENVSLPPQSNLTNGTYTATVYSFKDGRVFACGSRIITVSNDPTSTTTTEGGTTTVPGGGGGFTGGGSTSNQGPICIPDPNDPKKSSCTKAAGVPCGKGDNAGLMTAIGCVPTKPSVFIQKLLQFAIGAAGGIALLFMIFGAFRMITSAGSPEALKAGQDQFASAVIGLLFIIFAVLLLQIIGADILNIPGFDKSNTQQATKEAQPADQQPADGEPTQEDTQPGALPAGQGSRGVRMTQ